MRDFIPEKLTAAKNEIVKLHKNRSREASVLPDHELKNASETGCIKT